MENVPIENSKGLKRSKKIQGRRQQIQLAAAKPDDLDWSYMLNRNSLIMIAKASCIANFCKKQHLQYIVHIARLGNDSLQNQLYICVILMMKKIMMIMMKIMMNMVMILVIMLVMMLVMMMMMLAHRWRPCGGEQAQ